MDIPLGTPQVIAQGGNPELTDSFNAILKLHQDGEYEQARLGYEALLVKHPAQPAVWLQYAECCMALHGPELTRRAAERCLALDHINPQAMVLLSTALSYLGKREESRHWLKECYRYTRNYPILHWNLALCEILHGEWAGNGPNYDPPYYWPDDDELRGWKRYQWGRVTGHRPNRHIDPPWDGSDILGAGIYLYGEQGFGDIIWALRFLRDVRERCPLARIVLEVPESLVHVVHDQPFVQKYVDRVVAATPGSVMAEDCAYHAALWDIPAAIGLTVDTVRREPYITAPRVSGSVQVSFPPEQVRKVGLAWQGNPDHGADKWRSIHDLELLAPIVQALDKAGCHIYSLQPNDAPVIGGVQLLPAHLPSWRHTVALLPHLDLVIAPDTGGGHLAAAMGIPTWTMLMQSCDYRYTAESGSRSVWYESQTLFRQTKQGEWGDVVERIVQAIETKWPEPPERPEPDLIPSDAFQEAADLEERFLSLPALPVGRPEPQTLVELARATGDPAINRMVDLAESLRDDPMPPLPELPRPLPLDHPVSQYVASALCQSVADTICEKKTDVWEEKREREGLGVV